MMARKVEGTTMTEENQAQVTPMQQFEPQQHAEEATRESLVKIEDVTVKYSGSTAVEGVTFDIASKEITALIGPSGCGKTTFLRCLNRMNDLIPGARRRRARSSTTATTSTATKRRPGRRCASCIGMVFQKPNPFPKSIYDNIAFGPRVLGMKDEPRRTRRDARCAARTLGRGQGPPRRERARALRRPAAATLHRPRDRHVDPT